MREVLKTATLVIALLVAIDLAVAVMLALAERQGVLGPLIQYFEYGRSVPGKHDRWVRKPDVPGNLVHVAWPPDLIRESAEAFGNEDPDEGPVIRNYGMSFSNNILNAARQLDSNIRIDNHSGPGIPPNAVFALFEKDRENRRPGDLVVLAILSSSVPALKALTNATWVFEQPAPLTYPIYRPAPTGPGLARTDPLIRSFDAFMRARSDLALQGQWTAQLKSEDGFYGLATHGLKFLDYSPLMRLVRRSLATRAIARSDTEILSGQDFPTNEVLRRLVVAFASMAREDHQNPVVFLIQSRDRRDAGLYSILGPTLAEEKIDYLATELMWPPTEPAGYRPDGHFVPAVDARFAAAFLESIYYPYLDSLTD